jgi:hypothetical protein
VLAGVLLMLSAECVHGLRVSPEEYREAPPLPVEGGAVPGVLKLGRGGGEGRCWYRCGGGPLMLWVVCTAEWPSSPLAGCVRVRLQERLLCTDGRRGRHVRVDTQV